MAGQHAAGSAYQQVTLVGDSVLLGASPYLLRRLPGASVEAKVGRQGGEGLKLVQSLREQALLGEAAVIHLGTNGYLSEKQFRTLLEQLAHCRTVVVVNVYGARRWTGPNNALIARLAPHFENVRVVDWYAIGQANPAYFVQDFRRDHHLLCAGLARLGRERHADGVANAFLQQDGQGRG